MAEGSVRPNRGPLVACWLVLFLTGAAAAICLLIWGPAAGLPKAPGDGSLLIMCGVAVGGVSPFALLLLFPARKVVPSIAPRLWLYTRISAFALAAYIAWVGYLLVELSQATDL
jgi:hypothetical protein